MPGDGGEVRHDAGVVLHHDLAVHDAPRGGAVPVLRAMDEINYELLELLPEWKCQPAMGISPKVLEK